MSLFAVRGRRAAAVGMTMLMAAPAGASGFHAPPRPPAIRHVFVIVLENKNYDATFGAGSAAPYLAHTLVRAGGAAPAVLRHRARESGQLHLDDLRHRAQ